MSPFQLMASYDKYSKEVLEGGHLYILWYFGLNGIIFRKSRNFPIKLWSKQQSVETFGIKADFLVLGVSYRKKTLELFLSFHNNQSIYMWIGLEWFSLDLNMLHPML